MQQKLLKLKCYIFLEISSEKKKHGVEHMTITESFNMNDKKSYNTYV
jgi:hypothetical protein